MSKSIDLQNDFLTCKVQYLDDCKHIRITGNIINRDIFKNVLLLAANPTTKTSSYAGTGLPFPCADIDFDGTKNIYKIDQSGSINTTFTYPNSYYTVCNKKKIVSSIFFVFEHNNNKQEFVRFELDDMYPLRTLINRESRNGPEFYETKHQILHIDTSEEIMREYAKIKVSHNIA